MLKRGISKTTENVDIVTKARNQVLHDISEFEEASHLLETPEYTFILPNLSKYSEDFRAFLHKDLIETSTLVSLEQAGKFLRSWFPGSCHIEGRFYATTQMDFFSTARHDEQLSACSFECMSYVCWF